MASVASEDTYIDALELAVEMAEAIRSAEARISALEAENVKLRAFLQQEIPALQARSQVAVDMAERSEAARIAFEAQQAANGERVRKAEECVTRVRETLRGVRDSALVAGQRHAGTAAIAAAAPDSALSPSAA